jgi:hypothetical protein
LECGSLLPLSRAKLASRHYGGGEPPHSKDRHLEQYQFYCYRPLVVEVRVGIGIAFVKADSDPDGFCFLCCDLLIK